MFGEEGFDFLGPFGEAPAARPEIFLIADIIDFGDVLHAVEVEMINRFAIGIGVFVDNGEGGAADVLGDADLGTEFLDEGCFPHTHRAEEGEESFFGEVGEEALGGLLEVGYVRDGVEHGEV